MTPENALGLIIKIQKQKRDILTIRHMSLFSKCTCSMPLLNSKSCEKHYPIIQAEENLKNLIDSI